MKRNLIFLLFFSFPLLIFSQSSTTNTETSIQNISQLIEELGDSDFLTNYYAGRKILKFEKEAVPELIKALNHKKGKVRIGAIILLEQIKDERAGPEFIKIVKDKNKKNNERTICAFALGRMKIKEASPVLIECLSEDNTELKSACIIALGSLKEEKAVPYLMKFLNDKEDEIKRLSLRALKDIGENSIPEIEKMVNEGTFEEKLQALQLLGEIKGEKSVELLKKLLKNNDKYIAISSAYILSTIGNIEGEEIATKMKKDPDSKIRTLSIQTLENINKINLVKTGVGK